MSSWRGVASRARVPISAWPDSPEVAANASRGAGAGDHGRSKFFDRAESMTKSPQWRHSARPMTVARQSAVGSPRLATTSAARAQSHGHRHRAGSQPTSPPHSSIRCPSPFAARIPHQARAAWRECPEFPSSLFILLSITVYQTLHFFSHFSRSTPGFITPRCV